MAKWKAAAAAHERELKKRKEYIYQTFSKKQAPQPSEDIFTYIRSGEGTSILDKLLDVGKPLFFDTETHLTNRQIVLLQCYQTHWKKALVFQIKDVEQDLRPIYEKIKRCKIVAHNYAYDASTLCNDLSLPEDPFSSWDDTFYLARCAFWSNELFNLEVCLETVLGFSPYESVNLEKKAAQLYFMKAKFNIDDIDPKQLLYSAIDVYYLPYLWNEVSAYVQMWHYQVDKEFTHHIIKWEQHGMPIDQNILVAEIEKIASQYADIKSQLSEVNENSPKQVCAYLESEDSSKDTLNKIALMSQDIEKVRRAENILAARRLSKTRNFLERYSHERVKSYFAPSTKSGRAKATGAEAPGEDNLLQVPRHLKQVFGFEENDPRWMVYCDYAQLELRSATSLLGEKNLFKCFESGRDLHAHTAELMFHLPYDECKTTYKDKRQVAKQCNFALLYCASVATLQQVFYNDGAKFSEDETADLRRKWKNAYPQVAKWQNDLNKQYDSGKLDRKTPNGRHYLPKFFSDMCGIENQSIGADAAKLALNLFCRVEPSAKVLCFIHDAIVVEASSEEEAKRFAKSLGDSMVLGWFTAIKHLKYPKLSMPLEVGICKNLKYADDNIAYQTSGKYEDYFNEEGDPMIFEEVKLSPYPKLRRCILDGDFEVYMAAIAADEMGYSFEEACDLLLSRIAAFKECFGVEELKVCITGSKVFRYEVCKDYKKARKSKARPTHLNALRDFLAEFDNCYRDERLEADDLCAYFRSTHSEDWILASSDKDILMGVPGKHFDTYHSKFVETSEDEAVKFQYLQAMMGDPADSIKGILGVGKVKAGKILADCLSEDECYGKTLREYRKAGLREEELITTLRLVKLNQFNGETIELFSPDNFCRFD